MTKEEIFGREELNRPIDIERLNNLFSSEQKHKEQKDEIKNRISMALKDPILQQGFEIICKNLSKLEKENNKLKSRNDELINLYNERSESGNRMQKLLCKRNSDLEKENAELKETVGKYQIGMFDEIEKRDKQLTKAKEIMNIGIEGIKHWGIVGGTERPFEKQAEMLFNLFLDKAEQFLKEIKEI